MTWPATATKVHLDQGTDDPRQARVELAALIDKFNELRTHVSAYMQSVLDDVDSPAALATLKAAGLDQANDFLADQRVSSVDAGALAGPLVTLSRGSATPAVSDALALVRFLGHDAVLSEVTYAEIGAEIEAVTAGSHAGRLLLRSAVAGALATRGYVGAGMVIGAPASGDQGAGTLNLEGDAFKDGVPFLPGATAADQEAGTATNVGVTPAVAHRHPSAAKAWCRLSGTNVIDADYNVISVTNNGTGDSTIFFDVDFSGNVGYCGAGTCQGPGGGAFPFVLSQSSATSPLAGSWRFNMVTANAIAVNTRNYHVFFGDQ